MVSYMCLCRSSSAVSKICVGSTLVECVFMVLRNLELFNVRVVIEVVFICFV